jgi:biopolymer transport protein ExbD
MNLTARQKTQPNIPTASMADIAFLLIIFFMVTISFEVDKTQVLLPKTAIRLEIPKKAAFVSITELGNIKVSDGEEISVPVNGVEDVLSFANETVASSPGKPFVLKADSKTPYATVDRVIDALKQAKVEVIYLLSEQETIDNLGSV